MVGAEAGAAGAQCSSGQSTESKRATELQITGDHEGHVQGRQKKDAEIIPDYLPEEPSQALKDQVAETVAKLALSNGKSLDAEGEADKRAWITFLKDQLQKLEPGAGVNPPGFVEGKAWSDPETPPADPPAQLDKVVTSPRDPHSPPLDLHIVIRIIAYWPLKLVVTAPGLWKSLGAFSCLSFFREARAGRYPSEPTSLAPVMFYEQDGKFFLMGYDSVTNRWITSSPLRFKNGEDVNGTFKQVLSKETKSVAGHVGLLCVFGEGIHIAYNPLTKKRRQLPAMRHPRPPCVTNLHVTVAENRYQVIAIGSQEIGTHPRETEIYDSKTDQWTDAAELPEGCSIDNQTGVFLEGYWFGIGSRYTNLHTSKVLMVLDLKNLNWLDAIDLPSRMAFPTTVQLLQCNGEIYLFSQDVHVLDITHCIYRLNPGSEGGYRWTKKVNDKFKKGHFSDAEYTCVPVKGKQGGKVGIFKTSCRVNAVTESVCRVYDITEDEAEITAASQFLPCPPFVSENAVLFHPKHPVGYSFEPSFFVDV